MNTKSLKNTITEMPSKNIQENEEFGVIYLAFGIPYLSMALVSFESLRKTNPGVPVCIVTNVCGELTGLTGWDYEKDTWTYIDGNSDSNRNIKTNIIDYSPFDKTLYIDCDTVIVSDISLCGFFLRYFDICFKGRYLPQLDLDRGNRKIFEGRFAVSELPHWNGGVFMFTKNERVRDFFKLWNLYYKKLDSPYDQTSLVEAVFRSECRILSLGERWNMLTGRKEPRYDPSNKIVHYTKRIDAELGHLLIQASRNIPSMNGIEAEDILKDFIKQRKRQQIERHGHIALWKRRLKGFLFSLLPWK